MIKEYNGFRGLIDFDRFGQNANKRFGFIIRVSGLLYVFRVYYTCFGFIIRVSGLLYVFWRALYIEHS